MGKCAQCGGGILFGGIWGDGLHFCRRRCHDLYTEEQAHKAYQQAYQDFLRQLRKAPTDPHLKQKALEAGRNYAAWTRRGKGVTIFDEVALANDIAAACASASAPSMPVVAPLTLEQRLERLQTLLQQGLISDQEYASKRKEILAEL